MAETFVSEEEHIPLREAELTNQDWDLSLLEHPNAKYSAKLKLRLAETYARCGNMKAAAAECGVRYDLALGWKKKAVWWAEAIIKIQKVQQSELDTVMTDAINQAIFQMTDRINNGDYVRDTKTGEIVRVPMKGKELAVSAAVVFDKRSLIRGDATSISSKKIDPLKDIEKNMINWHDKLIEKKERMNKVQTA